MNFGELMKEDLKQVSDDLLFTEQKSKNTSLLNRQNLYDSKHSIKKQMLVP